MKQPKPILSDYTEETLQSLCQAAISRTEKAIEHVQNLPPEQCSIDNTLLAIDRIFAEFSDTTAPLTFMAYVHTDPKIAHAATLCEQQISNFSIDIMTRKALYIVLKAAKPTTEAQKVLYKEVMRGFEYNGLNLKDSQREILKDLKQELALLESKFSQNLNTDTTEILLSKKELSGVKEEVFSWFTQDEHGKYHVPMKGPVIDQVMRYTTSSATRKKIAQAYENRGMPENLELFHKALSLRSKIATLMGYPSWVDYRIQGRMATSSAQIFSFLKDLKKRLSANNQREIKEIKDFKSRVLKDTSTFGPWDIAFILEQEKNTKFDYHEDVIQEFFPAEAVVNNMLGIYADLLSVRFEEVPSSTVWHPSVRYYQALDKNGQILGAFYTDFLPRPGKYGHAAAFTLLQGRILEDGSYSIPVSAIVANFSPALPGKPILLKHGEVETLFHEFGHIMHQILTRAPYAWLAGTAVSQDFVEAPSQMLENWVYDPQILNRLSGHYQDPSKKLPLTEINKLIALRKFRQSYFYTRQLLFAFFDLECHRHQTHPENFNASDIYRKLYREIVGIEPLKNGNFPASFGHMMGGYDAGYYGYLWSKVYAQDLFSEFQAKGLLNPVVGAQYRKHILEMGKMANGFTLMERFLGRKPSNKAFYDLLGLQHNE